METLEKIAMGIAGILIVYIFFNIIKSKIKKRYWEGETINERGEVVNRWIAPKDNLKQKIPIR